MKRPRQADRIERTDPADLMFLALQGTTVPQQFGAVLVLGARAGFDVAAASRVLLVTWGRLGQVIDWVGSPTSRVRPATDGGGVWRSSMT
jgi:uncharacterized membrane protein